jgi:hypothetical protein
MEDKITIIEGPPPTFEAVENDWVLGLNETPNLSGIAVTRLRTFNGQELLNRCQDTWKQDVPMWLEYRNFEGLKQEAMIIAARSLETEEGDMLVLWVRLPDEGIELEIGYEDDYGDEEDDPGMEPF